MADPLSITASVLTLITVSVKVTYLLKQFHDEVSGVDATLTGLLGDISNLQNVLESMKETFDHDEIKANLQATGHAGNHWKNLARSLEDGGGTLRQLTNLLESVNKTTSFLDGPRKQLRFRSAIDQIAIYREQIQSYRAALQLSLSTIILWNQVNVQKSTDKIPEKIIPTLDNLYDEFRSFGALLNAKIEKLQKAVLNQNDRDTYEELTSMSNLRECVRAAADVVSTASSTLTVDASDKKSVKHGSDFGDLFTHDTNETMMRWMSSNTVYEYEEMSPLPEPSEASTGDARTEYPSDSDSDLETDIFRALFNNAKKLMDEGDLVGAERKLCNCLVRLNANASTYSLKSAAANETSRAELLERLIEVYCLLSFWPKAKLTMKEKLSITERKVGKKDELYLTDLLKLGEIMVKNHEYVEAHLQGRRCLRGFKKLGESGYDGYEKSLVFLVQLCNADKKDDEEEAYAALLGSHRAANKPQSSTRPGSDTPQISNLLTWEVPPPKSLLNPPNLPPIQSSTSKSLTSQDQPRDEQSARKESRLQDEAASHPTSIRLDTNLKAMAATNHDTPVASGYTTNTAGSSVSDPTDNISNLASELDNLGSLREEPNTTYRPSNTSDFEGIPSTNNDDHAVRPDATRHNTASDEESENSVATERLNSASSNEFTRSENTASANEASESGRSTSASEDTTTQDYADTHTKITKPNLPQVQSIQRRPVGAPADGLTGSTSIIGHSSRMEGAQLPNSTGHFETHAKEKLSHMAIKNLELAEGRQDAISVTKITASRRVPKQFGSELISIWDGSLHATTVAGEVRSETWAGSVNLGMKRNHPGTPYDLLTTFCRLTYGQIPYLTCMWSSDKYWSCRIVLECINQDWEAIGKRTLTLATEDAVALAYKELISLYTEELIAQGTRLRDPYSDKEVVEPELTELSWSGSVTLGRPPLVATSSSGVPLITVSSEQHKYGWSEMFGRLIRRSGSDSRLPRNHVIGSTNVREFGGDTSSTSSQHRHGISLLDADLIPRSLDLAWSPSEVTQGPETVHDESLACPVCNESLSGLSEATKLRHVNSCIDGSPIPISELRTEDEVPPTPAVPAASAFEDSTGLFQGTWACGYCKSHRVQLLGENTCTSCGGRRANHYPSSINDFERQPFERYRTLFTSIDFSNLTTMNGSVIRRKVLLLGDTLCGKTWLASSWSHNRAPESDTPALNNFIKRVTVGEHDVEIVIWDNSGMENYERLRRLSYEDVHVILICFDISEPDSIENVQYMWNDEVNKYLRGVPKILVGCKKDLRNDVRALEEHWKVDTRPVSPYKGDDLARRIGALAYFETTAEFGSGIQELFDYVAEASLKATHTKKSSKTAAITRFMMERGK